MPRSVKDIRELVQLAGRKDVKSVIVKKNASSVTKFKLRGSRFVYTLAVNDAEKVKKIISSFPPGTDIVNIEKKAPKKAVA